MKAAIAYRDATDTPEALELTRTLRRTTGCDVVVVAVFPPTADDLANRWVDKDYDRVLDAMAQDAERSARSALEEPDADVDFVRVASTSVAHGLLDTVEATGADVLVAGSARAAVKGSLLVGSVAGHLLHSSPVPILLAPEGYRDDGARFASITCSYAGREHSQEALAASCELAIRFDARLRVATFVPRAATVGPAQMRVDVEDLVASEGAEQAAALHEEAARFCRDQGVRDVRTHVARGRGWEGALHDAGWGAHDLLVMGSSRRGPAARVFVGSTAVKILRHTPVPALVVPSGSFRWAG